MEQLLRDEGHYVLDLSSAEEVSRVLASHSELVAGISPPKRLILFSHGDSVNVQGGGHARRLGSTLSVLGRGSIAKLLHTDKVDLALLRAKVRFAGSRTREFLQRDAGGEEASPRRGRPEEVEKPEEPGPHWPVTLHVHLAASIRFVGGEHGLGRARAALVDAMGAALKRHCGELPAGAAAASVSLVGRHEGAFADGSAWHSRIPSLRAVVRLGEACGTLSPAAPDEAAVEVAEAAARLPWVHAVEPGAMAVLPRNAHASRVLQSGETVVQPGVAPPFHAAGVRGEGEVVGMADTGIDFDMCYFRDTQVAAPVNTASAVHRKLVEYQTQDGTDARDAVGGHGTHTVGTVAGFSIAGHTSGDGMAPEARIHFLDMQNNSGAGGGYLTVPDDVYADMLQPAYSNGARLHSDSWGDALPTDQHQWPQYTVGGYDSIARDMDDFMFDQSDMLVLVAAGNDGDVMSTVAAPAVLKNGLAVGATSNTQESWAQMGYEWTAHGMDAKHPLVRLAEAEAYYSAASLASFSSKGPTVDGRFKPDLVAPGYFLVSARSDGLPESDNCATTVKAGTSMATPALAGTLALLRQAVRTAASLHGKQAAASMGLADTPSAPGALVKALAIGSADPREVATAQGGLESSLFAHIAAPWPLPRQVVTDGPACVTDGSDPRHWRCTAGYAWANPAGVRDGEEMRVDWAAQHGQQVAVQLVCQAPIGSSMAVTISAGGVEITESPFCGPGAPTLERAFTGAVNVTVKATVTLAVGTSALSHGAVIVNALEYASSARDRAPRQLSCADTAASWPDVYLAPAAARTAAADVVQATWLDVFRAVYAVRCPPVACSLGAGGADPAVYGTMQYQATSSVCLAAQHRGVRGRQGAYAGTLWVQALGTARAAYESSVLAPLGPFTPAGWSPPTLFISSVGMPSVLDAEERPYSADKLEPQAKEGRLISQSATSATAQTPGSFAFLVADYSGATFTRPSGAVTKGSADGGQTRAEWVDSFSPLPRKRPLWSGDGGHWLGEELRAAHPWFGFGMPRLTRAVPLPADLPRSRVLALSTGGAASAPVHQGETHSHCFQVAASEPFHHPVDTVSVTLVWTDPTASAGAWVQLVHDLDLVVDVFDGNAGPGNVSDWGNASVTLHGNGATADSPDDRNNAEKVIVAHALFRRVCARVVGRRVPLGGGQRYALTAAATCADGCLHNVSRAGEPVVPAQEPSGGGTSGGGGGSSGGGGGDSTSGQGSGGDSSGEAGGGGSDDHDDDDDGGAGMTWAIVGTGLAALVVGVVIGVFGRLAVASLSQRARPVLPRHQRMREEGEQHEVELQQSADGNSSAAGRVPARPAIAQPPSVAQPGPVRYVGVDATGEGSPPESAPAV